MNQSRRSGLVVGRATLVVLLGAIVVPLAVCWLVGWGDPAVYAAALIASGLLTTLMGLIGAADSVMIDEESSPPQPRPAGGNLGVIHNSAKADTQAERQLATQVAAVGMLTIGLGLLILFVATG